MASTYTNPVYRHASPDPFVLKYCGEYWCYFTGIRPDGRCFGILRSPDLVTWQAVGSALDPLPGDHTCYWAPEVTYDNGRFMMYYSVGNEENMEIRVAVSGRPQGPFVDSGHRLTTEKFAIDPHVFIDDDGTRYLFYATDFLDYNRVGTGTVYDRLVDSFTLAGRARPVTRARYDWQVYDPKRVSKGGVRWHAVEGPFVLKHAGRYYQMFSGGNWHNDSYGVGYAVARDLAAPDEWQQVCDGQTTLPILRSRPDVGVIGPGHNSVVRGPDNCELYCVYHRWQSETRERVLAIDPLSWEGERLLVSGPSTTPQPGPARPVVEGFGGFEGRAGRWDVRGGEAVLASADGEGRAVFPLSPPLHISEGDFVLEVSLAVGRAGAQGAVGLDLLHSSESGLSWALRFGGNSVDAGFGQAGSLVLPGLDPRVFHLLRLEVRKGEAKLILDHPSVFSREAPVQGSCRELQLWVRDAEVTLRGLAVAGCSPVA